MRKYLSTLRNAGEISLGTCHRVLVFAPKRLSLNQSRCSKGLLGRAGEKGPILGKEIKNIICVWPRRLGEDVTPVYKYSGNVNIREGSKLI